MLLLLLRGVAGTTPALTDIDNRDGIGLPDGDLSVIGGVNSTRSGTGLSSGNRTATGILNATRTGTGMPGGQSVTGRKPNV